MKSGLADLNCAKNLGADAHSMDLYGPIARQTDQPMIFAQIGQSLDGRVATVTDDSRDISGHDGLVHLHRLRALADAVVIGVKTAVQDQPQLTVRLAQGENPARVVIDPTGRLPNDTGLLLDESARRIVIQACDVKRPAGVEVIQLGRCTKGWIDAQDIADALIERGFRKILIEGGGITIAQFLEAGLLDRLHVTIAPLLIGSGPQGLSTTAAIPSLAHAMRPETRVFNLGSDILFDCALSGLGKPAVAGASPDNHAPTLTAH